MVLPNLMILLLREYYLVCDRKQLVMKDTHLKSRVSPHPQTTPHVYTYLGHSKKSETNICHRADCKFYVQ